MHEARGVQRKYGYESWGGEEEFGKQRSEVVVMEKTEDKSPDLAQVVEARIEYATMSRLFHLRGKKMMSVDVERSPVKHPSSCCSV